MENVCYFNFGVYLMGGNHNKILYFALWERHFTIITGGWMDVILQ